jgi:hypothetical protein
MSSHLWQAFLDAKRLPSYYQSVKPANGTVQQPRSGRRVVRRSAIDQAADTALCELPAELRPLLFRYAENIRQGHQIRLELSTLMTRNGLRWSAIDAAVRPPM